MKKHFKLILSLLIIGLASQSAHSQLVKRKNLNLGVKEVKRKKGNQKTEKNTLNKSAIFTVEVEKKLIEGIDKTIKFYKKQSRRLSLGSPARLKMQQRVLELHLEQASYVRAEEERKYERIYQNYEAGGGRGQPPKINTRRSTQHWKSVIKQSDVIMKEYPRHATADRTIYTKGFALSFLGKEKDAARIYTQLIERFPNSKVAGDAYTSLGDYFFNRNDYRNSLSNYKRAMKYRQADQYLWAVFKVAWCYYNLGKNKTSLAYWKKVVREASGSKKFSGLRDEALRDMVYAFAELRDVDGAINYYRKNGGKKHIGGMLNLLARELSDDGNYKEAIRTLKLFQKLLPTNPGAPEAQKEITSLTFELGGFNQAWKELIKMYKLYGTPGSWQNANRGDRKTVLETRLMVKEQILYYAKLLHQRGQKTDNKTLHLQAKKGYSIFLRTYPKAREAVEVKYNLADIEFFLKQYRLSGKQYLEIVLRGPKKAVIFDANTKKSNNVHQISSVYMVDSYARDFLPEFTKMQKRKPDFTKKQRPLSSRAKNYIRACTTYLKYYPKDKKLKKTCEVDISKVYYLSGDKKNSKKNLMVIATGYPKDKDGREAAEFLIPLFANDKATLLKVADRLLRVPQYKVGPLGVKLRAVRRGAEKEAVEAEKDLFKRAKSYQALAKKNPKDPEADVLWYKAADNFFKSGAIPSAIAAYLTIPKKYPKSKLAPDALIDVAFVLERQLNFASAGLYFSQFADKYPKDKRSAGAKSKACDLLLAEGSSKAGKICGQIIARKPDEGKRIAWKMIMNAERRKNYKEMSVLIEKIYKRNKKLSLGERISADYKLYKFFGGAVKKRAAKSMMASFKKAKELSGAPLRFVGEVIFDSANTGMSGYAKLGLAGGTVDRLQKSIERKGSALLKLKQRYESVLNSGDSFWSVAAMHQLGLAHELFAELLKNPPAIKGAKTEEVAVQLKPQVDALMKEARNYFKNAFSLIKKYAVYNAYSQKVVSGFYRVKGDKTRFDDWIVSPSFIESPVPQTIAVQAKYKGN